MPELSRSQIAVYGAVAVALLLLGARAIRAEGDSGPPTRRRSSPRRRGGRRRVSASSSGGRRRRRRRDRRRRAPGVYRLPAGARVTDAVERAGGAAAARRWKRSTSRPASPTASRSWCRARAGRRAAATAAAAAEEGPISLGTATVEQLDTIDGIGPVTAGDIVEFRDQHGGLSSVDQLDQVSGIGPATMESLRGRLQP